MCTGRWSCVIRERADAALRHLVDRRDRARQGESVPVRVAVSTACERIPIAHPLQSQGAVCARATPGIRVR